VISKWDPFRDLAELQDRINRIFEDRVTRRQEGEPISERTWAPPVDIYEDESQLVVRAELPGLKREDIDIQVTTESLVISGERKLEEVGENEPNYIRIERPYGPFRRTFSISVPVKPGETKAAYKEGLLEIVIPKAEEAQPKKIQVEVD
jgi:HSP20 family protein